MPRQRLLLTPEAAAALQRAELAERDGPTRARLQAVRLYGLGFAVAMIQTVTGLSRSRLMECCRAYREEGIPGLADGRRGGNNFRLSPAQVEELGDRLRQSTPRSLFGHGAATRAGQLWTLADLKRAVELWYGVVYDSPTSYYSLAARCGVSLHRPALAARPGGQADDPGRRSEPGRASG